MKGPKALCKTKGAWRAQQGAFNEPSIDWQITDDRWANELGDPLSKRDLLLQALRTYENFYGEDHICFPYFLHVVF